MDANALVVGAREYGGMAAAIGALVTAVGVLFRYIIKTHKAQLEDMKAERNASRKMLFDLLHISETVVNRNRALEGREPFEYVPPVVPWHSSPVTNRQQQDADMETLKARVAVVSRELDVVLVNGRTERSSA